MSLWKQKAQRGAFDDCFADFISFPSRCRASDVDNHLLVSTRPKAAANTRYIGDDNADTFDIGTTVEERRGGGR